MIYITDKEQIAMGKFHAKLMKRLFLYTGKRVRESDNRKWAWIKVGQTKFLCYVDNVTMKAYKTDGYKPTYIEWKKFEFIRWATSFDL